MVIDSFLKINNVINSKKKNIFNEYIHACTYELLECITFTHLYDGERLMLFRVNLIIICNRDELAKYIINICLVVNAFKKRLYN